MLVVRFVLPIKMAPLTMKNLPKITNFRTTAEDQMRLKKAAKKAKMKPGVFARVAVRLAVAKALEAA